MAGKLKSEPRTGRPEGNAEPSRVRVPRVRQELPPFDRLIHERIRLGMVSALAINESLTFNDLKRILKTSDGNLAVHARKLEEAGYVRCRKFFDGRIPRTEYKLTPSGQKALQEYLSQMETFIAAAREQA
jgi:DNA-binding HxlR family transcriptional regulator